MPPARDPSLLAKAARLYFVEDRSQDDIAARLGTTRSNVSRMLKQARDLGIVEIRIVDPAGRDQELEAALRARFGLVDARVLEATPESDVAHVTRRPASTFPAASFTADVSCRVSPTRRLSSRGATSTTATAGGRGPGSVPESQAGSPAAARARKTSVRESRCMPLASFVRAPGRGPAPPSRRWRGSSHGR